MTTKSSILDSAKKPLPPKNKPSAQKNQRRVSAPASKKPKSGRGGAPAGKGSHGGQPPSSSKPTTNPPVACPPAHPIVDFVQNLPACDLATLTKKHCGSPIEEKDLKEKQAKIFTVKQLKESLGASTFGLKFENGQPKTFIGTHWQPISPNILRTHLAEFAAKVGIPELLTLDEGFRRKLLKQTQEHLSHERAERKAERVLINLQNGTLKISDGTEAFGGHDKNDHLSHMLPFAYDPAAKCPGFRKFLDRVLPDAQSQKVLAEFLGWVFLPNLKLEKMLVLLGSGQNGKSVVFDVVHALLGKENVSSLSISELSMKENRFPLGDSLLNYGSELSHKLDSPNFKRLVSGEPLEARRLYEDPFTLTNYARLAFNANELPTGIEVNSATFRRFLILPFEVTIPDAEKDPDLAKKLCDAELPGIFNWVLDGMRRVHANRGFSPCPAAAIAIKRYQDETDPVAVFVNERVDETKDKTTPKIEVYEEFRKHCRNVGMRPVTMIAFGKRLRDRHHMVDCKSNNVRKWKFALKEADAVQQEDPPKESATAAPTPAPTASGSALSDQANTTSEEDGFHVISTSRDAA